VGICQKLNEEMFKKLNGIFVRILRSPRLEARQIPDEIYMFCKAMEKIYKGEVGWQNKNSHTKREIEQAINTYEQSVNVLLGISADYMNKAASKGLGFGVITNNGADMALYSAMNANEKMKNLTTASLEIKQSLTIYTLRLKSDLLKSHTTSKDSGVSRTSSARSLEKLEDEYCNVVIDAIKCGFNTKSQIIKKTHLDEAVWKKVILKLKNEKVVEYDYKLRNWVLLK